ncbi:kinetochore protein Spc24 [Sigmodon hispidus]
MAAFCDMKEVSYWLLSVLGAIRAEAQQQRLLRRHEQIDGGTAARDAGALGDPCCEGGSGSEPSRIERMHAPGRLCQLTTDLQELREMEANLQQQEKEVDEDTTITIPSAVYVAQLYHRISKEERDYECEPGTIKGIHHGLTVALPIHLDSTQLSQKFIRGYLWSLVDTEW